MRPAKTNGFTAGDIMSRELVTVPLNATLDALALILHENHITGAPVVDGDGHLAGVVSQSDLVRCESHPHAKPRIVPLDYRAGAEDDDQEPEEPRSSCYTHLDSADFAELRESFIEEDYGDATVADIFTPYTVTAAVDTPVETLAGLMVDKSVHRLIIVQGKKVVGIVTSMDILRTLVRSKPASTAHCLTAQH